MSEEVWKLLHSKKIADREKFFRLGAELDEPGAVIMYNEALGRETYKKLLLTMQGECAHTTNPVSVCLGTERWRVWHLGHINNVYLAYDPTSTEVNGWWADLEDKIGKKCARAMPQMFGHLVVFCHETHLPYNELELRRELINFLVSRYVIRRAYYFSGIVG